MRIPVNLNAAQIQALDVLSKRDKRSRVALIRQAIDDYLARRGREDADDAFGLWSKQKVDGLVHQKKTRSEW
jgi:metal-responsive CopG/Arc/MetJ family transcriptional regulator